MKAELLETTESGQKKIAEFWIDANGDLKSRLVDPLARLDRILKTTVLMPDGTQYDSKKNPKEWVENLPLAFNGSYLRARLV